MARKLRLWVQDISRVFIPRVVGLEVRGLI